MPDTQYIILIIIMLQAIQDPSRGAELQRWGWGNTKTVSYKGTVMSRKGNFWQIIQDQTKLQQQHDHHHHDYHPHVITQYHSPPKASIYMPLIFSNYEAFQCIEMPPNPANSTSYHFPTCIKFFKKYMKYKITQIHFHFLSSLW